MKKIATIALGALMTVSGLSLTACGKPKVGATETKAKTAISTVVYTHSPPQRQPAHPIGTCLQLMSGPQRGMVAIRRFTLMALRVGEMQKTNTGSQFCPQGTIKQNSKIFLSRAF